MRIAILSDIHANLEALKAVLEDADGRGYDRLYCLGDVVGYGANPEECAALIRERVWRDEDGEAIVRGNHDDAVAVVGNERGFNPAAREAVLWTRGHICEETRQWLDALPYRKSYPDCLLVHSSPNTPEAWTYLTSVTHADSAFQAFLQPLAFIGHSHIPFAVSMPKAYSDKKTPDFSDEIALELETRRYLVNVGSVGQPRDGIVHACYILWDTQASSLRRVRVPYDIDAAARKIRDAGLPSFLAERLLKGR